MNPAQFLDLSIVVIVQSGFIQAQELILLVYLAHLCVQIVLLLRFVQVVFLPSCLFHQAAYATLRMEPTIASLYRHAYLVVMLFLIA